MVPTKKGNTLSAQGAGRDGAVVEAFIQEEKIRGAYVSSADLSLSLSLSLLTPVIGLLRFFEITVLPLN